MIARVDDATKNGFTPMSIMRVTALGGVDPRVLLGQEVIVHGRQELPGVIASTPPHLLKAGERDKILRQSRVTTPRIPTGTN